MRFWFGSDCERTIIICASQLVRAIALASSGTPILERHNDVQNALSIRQVEYEETGRATFLLTDVGKPCDPFIDEEDKGGSDDFLVSVFLLPGAVEEVRRLRIFHDALDGQGGILEELFIVRDNSPACQAAASILERERLLPGTDIDAFLAEKPNEGLAIDDFGNRGDIFGRVWESCCLFPFEDKDFPAARSIFHLLAEASAEAPIVEAASATEVAPPPAASVRVWHVDASNGDDARSGRSPLEAKATLQAAVDLAGDGDRILVADGVYAPIDSGGKRIMIESAHGASATVIDGGGRHRCATLGGRRLSETNTVLVGFTLRNGCRTGRSSRDARGGGAQGGTLRKCLVEANVADFGGGTAGSVLEDCVVSRNYAYRSGGGCFFGRLSGTTVSLNRAGTSGGGAYGVDAEGAVFVMNYAHHGGGGLAKSSAKGCLLLGNRSDSGGGAKKSLLLQCVLQGNEAARTGGGADRCVAIESEFTRENSARDGGGMSCGVATNCLFGGNYASARGGGMWKGRAEGSSFEGNTAVEEGGGICEAAASHSTFLANLAGGRRILGFGGGASLGDLHFCTLSGNFATSKGGAVSRGSATHCTIVGNTAPHGGGGIHMSAATNSIVLRNGGSPQGGNWLFSELHGAWSRDGRQSMPQNYDSGSSLSHCCADPAPPDGGNFTADPLFCHYGEDPFYLVPTSPCVGRSASTEVDAECWSGGVTLRPGWNEEPWRYLNIWKNSERFPFQQDRPRILDHSDRGKPWVLNDSRTIGSHGFLTNVWIVRASKSGGPGEFPVPTLSAYTNDAPCVLLAREASSARLFSHFATNGVAVVSGVETNLSPLIDLCLVPTHSDKAEYSLTIRHVRGNCDVIAVFRQSDTQEEAPHIFGSGANQL